jgi:hypothetical protein
MVIDLDHHILFFHTAKQALKITPAFKRYTQFDFYLIAGVCSELL